MEKLAVDGGKAVRTKPFPPLKKVGDEELEELRKVIESGNLFRGPKVKEFEERFAELYGVKRAVSSTSGTAAIHVAMAMLNLNPGNEVITGPITDIGTVIPILAQNAIPIFADILPDTFNLDPEDVERKITPKTKAIIAVHLFGNPSDMEGLLRVARKHGIALVEDCAQAHLASYKGRLLGTIGDIGCFSFQQSKHMITGDGGMTITDDDEYGDRGAIFVDKGWERWASGPRHYAMFGMNYRMTELQAAVGIAQIRRVKWVTDTRNRLGDMLSEMISDVGGIKPQKVLDGCRCVYWYYGMVVEEDAPFTAGQFAKALSAEGIPAGAHYIGKPIFLCHEAVRKGKIYGDSDCPFGCKHTSAKVEYVEGLCPVAESVLSRLVTMSIHEFMSEEDIRDIARAVRKVSEGLAKR
jgi:dTDP-4-amino-4,6-dideoxygalactose transaminase